MRKFLWKGGFFSSDFHRIEMTRFLAAILKRNKIFYIFSWNMVVISVYVYIYGVKIL